MDTMKRKKRAALMTKEEIRELREFYDETQEEFARRCKVTVSTVAKWEQGQNSPLGLTADTLHRWLTEARANGKKKEKATA